MFGSEGKRGQVRFGLGVVEGAHGGRCFVASFDSCYCVQAIRGGSFFGFHAGVRTVVAIVMDIFFVIV